MALSQAEQKRRKWRILYMVFQVTGDRSGRLVSTSKIMTDHSLEFESVQPIVEELQQRSLVQLFPGTEPAFQDVQITPTGATVIENASLDADAEALKAPPGATQIEHDAHLVLGAIAEYGKTDDDRDLGYHTLDEIDLQGLTNLPTRRLNEAVNVLTDKGWLAGSRTMVGHLLNWTGQLSTLGRQEYQRSVMQLNLTRPASTEDLIARRLMQKDEALMARKNTAARQTAPQMIVSRDDASGRIQKQVDQGVQLQSRDVESESALQELVQDYNRWYSYNCELLKRLFDNDSIAQQYYLGRTLLNFHGTVHIGQKMDRFRRKVADDEPPRVL